MSTQLSQDRNINYAMVSAFERSKEREKRHVSLGMFTVLLMAVFFIALMGGLVAGVSMYRNISADHAHSNTLHLQAGLLANTVHLNDMADAVEIGEGPEGPALVLVQRLDSGTYETRLYQFGGYVVQEYVIAGRAYKPVAAERLVQSDTFEFTYENGLITFTTDQGTFDVALRSAQEGAAREGASMVAAQDGAAQGGGQA